MSQLTYITVEVGADQLEETLRLLTFQTPTAVRISVRDNQPAVLGVALPVETAKPKREKAKRHMSAEGKARVAAGQRRWAKFHAKKNNPVATKEPGAHGRISAEGWARIQRGQRLAKLRRRRKAA